MAELTCIVCPLGCRVSVKTAGEQLEISGYSCKRGEAYARNEAVEPKRMLTGVVAVSGTNRPLPVKTAAPIPKAKIFEAMAEIKQVRVPPPIRIGQVIRKNLAGTGVSLVATNNTDSYSGK